MSLCPRGEVDRLTGERADVFSGRDVVHVDHSVLRVGAEDVLTVDRRTQQGAVPGLRDGGHERRTRVWQPTASPREAGSATMDPLGIPGVQAGEPAVTGMEGATEGVEGPAARMSTGRRVAVCTSRTIPCTVERAGRRVSGSNLQR